MTNQKIPDIMNPEGPYINSVMKMRTYTIPEDDFRTALTIKGEIKDIAYDQNKKEILIQTLDHLIEKIVHIVTENEIKEIAEKKEPFK